MPLLLVITVGLQRLGRVDVEGEYLCRLEPCNIPQPRLNVLVNALLAQSLERARLHGGGSRQQVAHFQLGGGDPLPQPPRGFPGPGSVDVAGDVPVCRHHLLTQHCSNNVRHCHVTLDSGTFQDAGCHASKTETNQTPISVAISTIIHTHVSTRQANCTSGLASLLVHPRNCKARIRGVVLLAVPHLRRAVLANGPRPLASCRFTKRRRPEVPALTTRQPHPAPRLSHDYNRRKPAHTADSRRASGSMEKNS
mmetsp:Transcript_18419/g.44418  ORF Transcript_18419/g.44418 Transcript_18419/m.44418 type:complete len:252 (-) Transcript_18419:14-769(-)